MSENNHPLANWKMWILAVVILVAFIVGTYSIYRAAETGDDARKALCNVLLVFRAETLRPDPMRPRTPDQLERVEVFWRHTISLVEGCQIPRT